MTRWMIEKDGTGIEKSGTGIEKSGTGIEKSGTGIEKSGTGFRKVLMAIVIASITFTAQLSANNLRPEGSLSVVVHGDSLLVSWIIDGSVFSGVASLQGSSTNLSLTEVSLVSQEKALDTTGGGTGSKTDTTGGGTGIETTGGGTGVRTTGGGTGVETTGGGTGVETTGGGTGVETTGGGTGVETTGGGTGVATTGGGTGTIILTTGGGTGAESIAITLPSNTGLEMEVTLSCQTASVSVLDSDFAEVVSFNNIKVMGDTGLCQDGDDSDSFWFEEDTYK